MTAKRNPLPLRRSHEVLTFTHWEQTFIVGIGRSTPGAPIAEIWINTAKTGTQAETLARDSAVLLSLALQYGVPISAMRRAIMRDLDGKASGPIGRLLDLLTEEDDGRASESTPRIPDDGRGSAVAQPADCGERAYAD